MRRYLLFLTFLIVTVGAHSQLIPFGNEKMVGHLNKRSLQSGEILRIALANFSEKNSLSHFSKIAYVELLDGVGQSVIKTKLTLIGGLGDGKVFIPTSLPTGRYVLVAYTQWMANFGLNGAFASFVTIVNPYKSLKINKSNTHLTSDTLYRIDRQFSINLGEKYPMRKEVTLDFIPPISGHITISIHRIDSISSLMPEANPIVLSLKSADQIYLPDYRGELITGTFSSPNQKGKDQIYMSIPQYNNQVRVTQTDSSGRFIFINHNVLDQEEIWFSVEKRPNGKFEYDDRFIAKHLALTFDDDIRLDSTLIAYIQQRCIEIQIENAYQELYADSVPARQPTSGFGEPLATYHLDDYTRFKSVNETIKEYVKQVTIRKRDGKNRFFLLSAETGARQIQPPLLLLNGFPIYDPDILINYNPFDIKKIEVINTRYVFGQLEYGGILNFVTFQKPLTENIEGQQNFLAKNIGVQPKSYFNSEPSTVSSNHPDFRSQLLWLANLPVHASERIPIQFITPDITGTYEVNIWIVDLEGKDQLINTTFVVTKDVH